MENEIRGFGSGMHSKGPQRGSSEQIITTELMVPIYYNKRVICCKTYEKMNGRYFAAFIENHFDRLFAAADKG